jgi:hypothetical protein
VWSDVGSSGKVKPVGVEWTEKPVSGLIGSISNGEIRLPEIQRGYVWKPTQIAKYIESLYLGYPSGSLLFWKTSEPPSIRDVAADAPNAMPAHSPLYLLDGQQRLTSLHRVFHDHPRAQIVFNVERELFQNQSAATRRDRRWIKVFDVLKPDADAYQLRDDLIGLVDVTPRELGTRLSRIERIRDYKYHMEVLDDFTYEQVAQIFVRVNSGRKLGTLDLAMATLSARWAGILAKLEEEADRLALEGYGSLDVGFLSRALAAVVLGRGLSGWSHARLKEATDQDLEKGWATVQRGIRHLVPLLKGNLKLTRVDPLPSTVALIPLVVLLGERPETPLDSETANGIIYWLLLALIRNRYSGSTDTVLSQDIPAARSPQPVRQLLANLGLHDSTVEVADRVLVGRSRESPYFFLSLLVVQASGATDWWFGTQILPGLEGGQRLEYHHIHPVDTLEDFYSKSEINELANLAFISSRANKRISNKSPVEYFPTLGAEELSRHFVPAQPRFREVQNYPQFLAARRKLLADAMTDLINRFRPSWLDQSPLSPPAVAEGYALNFSLYEGGWDQGVLVLEAAGEATRWAGSVVMADLEAAITAAATGLDGDIEVSGETVPVRVVEEIIEVPMGPFSVVGTHAEWEQAFARERASVKPLSIMPAIASTPWAGDRRVFPVTETE